MIKDGHPERSERSIFKGTLRFVWNDTVYEVICMANVIATVIVVAAVAAASYYIYKEKKKGTRCIGCPMAGNCQKAKAGGCSNEGDMKA